MRAACWPSASEHRVACSDETAGVPRQPHGSNWQSHRDVHAPHDVWREAAREPAPPITPVRARDLGRCPGGLSMTLAYSALPAPTLRLVGPPGHKRRAWRQPSRSTRVAIGPGRPRSLSWSQLRWEDDDWAWYAVEHSGPLELEQIGSLIGVSEATVRHIQSTALAKLSELDPGMTGVQLGRLFAEWDRERHAERRDRERAARVEMLLREFAREYAGAAE